MRSIMQPNNAHTTPRTNEPAQAFQASLMPTRKAWAAGSRNNHGTRRVFRVSLRWALSQARQERSGGAQPVALIARPRRFKPPGGAFRYERSLASFGMIAKPAF